MRPLAFPVAGGVCSAIVLFSTWVVPTYPVRAANSVDVPTILNTVATVKGTAPIGVAGGDIVVDVLVDGQGRMIDYSVVSGTRVEKDEALRRRLDNFLLFTEFVPATSFGQPTVSRLRLTLGSNRVDVKG